MCLFIIMATMTIPIIVITWVPFGTDTVIWWSNNILDPFSDWLADID